MNWGHKNSGCYFSSVFRFYVQMPGVMFSWNIKNIIFGHFPLGTPDVKFWLFFDFIFRCQGWCFHEKSKISLLVNFSWKLRVLIFGLRSKKLRMLKEIVYMCSSKSKVVYNFYVLFREKNLKKWQFFWFLTMIRDK